MRVSSYSMKLYYAMTISLYLLAFSRILRLFGNYNAYYITGIVLIIFGAIMLILLLRSDKRFVSGKGWWIELPDCMPKGSRAALYLAGLVTILSLFIP